MSKIIFEILQEFKPKDLDNVKVLTVFSSPPAQVMSRKPVNSIADLKGITLRASGIMSDEVELLGGKPVSMPQSEAPDAISLGVVDGIFASIDVSKDMNYAETCRYGLLTNMSIYPFVVVMNKKTWESLPKEVQQAMDALALPHALWTGAYVDNHAKEALKWSQETYNVDYKEMTPEDRKLAMELVQPLINKWIDDSKDIPAKEAVEAIKNKVAQNN